MTHDNAITCTVLGFFFKDCHDVIIIVLILTFKQFRKYYFVKSVVLKSL